MHDKLQSVYIIPQMHRLIYGALIECDLFSPRWHNFCRRPVWKSRTESNQKTEHIIDDALTEGMNQSNDAVSAPEKKEIARKGHIEK